MVPVSSGLATGATTQTKRATHTNKQAANNSHMWAYVHVCVCACVCVVSNVRPSVPRIGIETNATAHWVCL